MPNISSNPSARAVFRTTKLAKSHALRPVLLASLIASMIAGACVFGGDSEETPTPTPNVPSRPAIGRSGPSPTPTVAGLPTARPTLPPPPTAVPQGITEGLVSVVYSYPFIWPAEGPITSFMGPEHPNGIDIGLDNSATMSVRAAAGGTVTAAGGTNDDALGIAITIDHGNGVTSTYGHLSRLNVSVGDTVQIGQVIGVGGSTGISTGNHLHFEVRKDGQTVDPLHILPSGGIESASFDVDCSTTPFTLPSGSRAFINFSGVLDGDERLVSVAALPRSGGPSIVADIDGDDQVRLQSAIDFDGPTGVDSYDLEVTVDRPNESSVLTCDFVVMRESVPTTFYVRAAPPANQVDEGAPAGSADNGGGSEDNGGGSNDNGGGSTTAPASTDGGNGSGNGGSAPGEAPPPPPTATPNPFAGTPNYQVPTPAPISPGGAGAQPPSYGPPGSGAPGAQPPTYNPPGQ